MASTKPCRSKSIGKGVRAEHTPGVGGLLESEHPSREEPRHGGAPLKDRHSERTLEAEGRNRSEPSPAENGTLNTVEGLLKSEHAPADEGLTDDKTLGDVFSKRITPEFLPPWQKPSSPMPSVYDLGREIAAMNNRYNELDEAEMAFVDPKLHEPLELTMKRHALSHAKSMAFARERALIDLALTLPAVTVADAAVMVMLAWHVSALLKDCSYDEHEENRKKTQIEHALLNALPLIANAAGVELGEIGFGGVDIWIDRVTQDIAGRAGT